MSTIWVVGPGPGLWPTRISRNNWWMEIGFGISVLTSSYSDNTDMSLSDLRSSFTPSPFFPFLQAMSEYLNICVNSRYITDQARWKEAA